MLVLTTVSGITAQAAYLEMQMHYRFTVPYYQTGIWLKMNSDLDDRIIIQEFNQDGIIFHSELPRTMFIPLEELPENATQALTFLTTHNISYIIWSLRDPICKTHSLLAPLAAGQNTSHFVLRFRIEDFISNVHELVMIYDFIP